MPTAVIYCSGTTSTSASTYTTTDMTPGICSTNLIINANIMCNI